MQFGYRCRLSGVAAVILGATALATSSSTASAASSLDVLYSFCGQSGCPDGDQPYGGVTLLQSGELLGTTGFGGKYNGGTVFSLNDKHGAEKLRTLKSFCVGKPPSCAPDEGPSVTLVVDKKGNIYGTVYFGGTSGDGAVFELEAKGGKKYALHYLHSFAGSDGDGPADLSYAGQNTGAPYDGKSPLYGATIAGGSNNSGTVYSLTPGKGGAAFQTLYNFCSAANCSDGNGPFAGLAQDSSGNFYGTTYFGGSANDGVVFELSASGQYSVLHNFCSEGNCTDGSEPMAAVTLDSSGNIFGTTSRGGGGNFGTMFEIASGTFQSIYSFCSLNGCSDGGYPYGTLAIDAKGNIFGTTQYGGAHDLGEVYELKQ
jgi:uncharacterized repeat protein (TIGR03803 family)